MSEYLKSVFIVVFLSGCFMLIIIMWLGTVFDKVIHIWPFR